MKLNDDMFKRSLKKINIILKFVGENPNVSRLELIQFIKDNLLVETRRAEVWLYQLIERDYLIKNIIYEKNRPRVFLTVNSNKIT